MNTYESQESICDSLIDEIFGEIKRSKSLRREELKGLSFQDFAILFCEEILLGRPFIDVYNEKQKRYF